jgi:hypothetical protein
LDLIGTKILRLLLHGIHSHVHHRSLRPIMVFLDLKFLQQQLERDGCLALFTLSLFLPFEVALFLYYHTVFYLFDIEKEIINASKKRKT